jgi:hypothetical protein
VNSLKSLEFCLIIHSKGIEIAVIRQTLIYFKSAFF